MSESEKTAENSERPLTEDAASEIRESDFLWDLFPVEMANHDKARIAPRFEITKYELEVLARHYFNVQEEHYFFHRLYQQWGSRESRECAFSGFRLRKISEALGENALDAALAKDTEKWRREYEQADARESQLPPCRRCGGKRTIADAAHDREGNRCADCAALE